MVGVKRCEVREPYRGSHLAPAGEPVAPPRPRADECRRCEVAPSLAPSHRPPLHGDSSSERIAPPAESRQSSRTGRPRLAADLDPMDGPSDPPDHGRRCVAQAKSTGQQCRRRPIPGGTVCVRHGGSAPQVALAARRRVDAQAQELAAAKLGLCFTPSHHAVPVPHADAVLRRLRHRQPRWFVAAQERDDRAFRADVRKGALAHALRVLEAAE